MNLHRFYCNPISQPATELTGSEAHHLAAVMRLVVGEKVELFDGNGAVAEVTVKTSSSKKVTLQVEDLKIFAKPVHQIILAVSVAKGERFDWLIEKCTELGVDRIVPVLFERTVKQPKNPKIVERWSNIAISAAKQSRRVFLPQIDKPMKLTEAVEVLKRDYPQGTLLLGSLSENSQSVLQCGFAVKDIMAFVGPEGGLTEEEENLIEKFGAEPVRLTDTILRIETAAIAFAALLAAKKEAERQK